MKLQTSIEFLIILSAVAVVSLFVISSYANIQNMQHTTFTKLDSAQVPANSVAYISVPNGNQNLSVYSAISNITYTNKSNQMEVLVSFSGTFEIQSLYVQGPPGVTVLPASYRHINYSSVGVLSFSVIPTVTGEYNLTVYSNISFGNQSLHEGSAVYSYAVRSANQTNTINGNITDDAFSVYIRQRNESVMYPFAAQTDIDTFGYGSHCAWHDWSGNREPEVQQCGAESWGFVVGDDSCNQFVYNGRDRYYCFYPFSTGDSVGNLGPTATPLYNATMVVYNNTLKLYSTISNLNSSSPLFTSSNSSYGNTTVLNAYVQGALSQPYQIYAIRNDSGILDAVNISTYSNYLNNEAALLMQLSDYNNTWPSGDALTYVLMDMARTNASASALVTAYGMNVTGCSIILYDGKYAYGCRPSSPLAYDIDANVLGYSGNESITYQGSLITVR